MTIRRPLFLQQDGPDAKEHRQLLAALWASEGVITDTGVKVTQRAAGANLSVDVSAGSAVVTGDTSPDQGRYLVDVETAENVPIGTAPNPSQGRIDLIVLRVDDAAVDAGGNNRGVLEWVTGTAGSGSPPAVPDTAYVLAEVAVGVGVASIVSANITDRRSIAGRTGTLPTPQVVFTTSATFVKAAHKWATWARYRVQAGGGGGGGAGVTDGSSGAGGGGGGYAEGWVRLQDLAAVTTVTVGGAGNGGGGANSGGNGGPSSFGVVGAATGGTGGPSRSSPPPTPTAGVGGAATAGDVLVNGQDGGFGSKIDTHVFGGAGGASHMGSGGQQQIRVPTASAGGRQPSGFGAGGGGAVNTGGGNAAGAAGRQGVVILELV